MTTSPQCAESTGVSCHASIVLEAGEPQEPESHRWIDYWVFYKGKRGQVFFEGVENERTHEIRPLGHLFRQTVIALLAFFVPLFAVLYWLTIPRDLWLPVALGQFVASGIILFGVYAHRNTCITVSPLGFSERGFFGRTTQHAAATVDTIVLLDMYQSDTLDTYAQLFVTGRNGKVLLRMRGQFWSRTDMETVIEELAAPVLRISAPMTLRELNRMSPELLYWFERRPVGRASS